MALNQLLSLVFFFFFCLPVDASEAIVDLGYSVYKGTTLKNGQNQFLGIRFAAPPVGDLRFRKPQSPLPTKGIQAATAFRPVCLGVKGPFNNGLPKNQGEDCLFLNVWSPSNVTRESEFPIFFWIGGGGYAFDFDANYNGSSLVQATGNKMIFVDINYRYGPFGFLASERVRKNGDINAGLLDQRFALKWVQQHISEFGGDPNKVVIVGDSAGAGSVAMHMLAYGGLDEKLFRGAFGMSPYMGTQLRVSELEWQFDLFASRAGCSEAVEPLACLRSKNATALQEINTNMPYPGRTNDAQFPYTPAIDGDFVRDFPMRQFVKGSFVKVPAIFGDDTNEGTLLAPNASSPAEIATYFQDQFPQLSEDDTNKILALYPPQLPNPFPQHALYFAPAAAALGEAVLICPGIAISTAIAKYTKSWNYRYNVVTALEKSEGLGSIHTSEIPLVFGIGEAGNGTGGFDRADFSLSPILQAYYTSFISSLDPNTHPVNGSVFWPKFSPENNKRLLLQVNATAVETIPQDQLRRCEFWKGMSIEMEQ